MTEDIFRFGISLSTADGRQFKGFLRPVDFSDETTQNVRAMPGVVNRAKYLLVAELNALTEEDIEASVFSGEAEFEVLRIERKYLGGQGSHIECLLRYVRSVEGD